MYQAHQICSELLSLYLYLADINECTEFRQREPCGRNAFCQNLDGSYQCQCPAGYIGDPYDCCHPEALECRKVKLFVIGLYVCARKTRATFLK